MSKYFTFYRLSSNPRFDDIKKEIEGAELFIDLVKKIFTDRINTISKNLDAEKKAAKEAIIWNTFIEQADFRIDDIYSNKEENKIFAKGYIIISECDIAIKQIDPEFVCRRNGKYFRIINDVLVPSDKCIGGSHWTALTPIAQLLTSEQVEVIKSGKLPGNLIGYNYKQEMN